MADNDNRRSGADNKPQPPAIRPDGTGTPAVPDKPGTDKKYVRQYVMRHNTLENWLSVQPRRMKRNAPVGKPYGAERPGTAPAADSDPERRRKAKILLIVMFFLLTAALAYPLVRLCMMQFVVGEVIVDGDVSYTQEELMAAAGIGTGDRLFEFDEKAAAAQTLERLAYLRSCSIEIKLPDTVIFRVSAGNAVIYTEVAGEYYALSATLRVLQRSQDGDTFRKSGLLYTELPRASRAVVGSFLELAGEVDTGYITDYIDTLALSELADRADRLFLDEKFNIVATVDGRYRVKFGSPSEMALKMLTAARVISSAELGENAYATVDVTDPSVAGIVPHDRLDTDKKTG